MSENNFLQKFKHKTNTELEQILQEKHKYTDQAIEASFLILEGRNGTKPESPINKIEMEDADPTALTANQAQKKTEKKKSYLTDDPNAPQMHSKKVIYMFSAIFSSIFGAALIMYNMKQTNNQKGRMQVLFFGISYTILSIVIINLLQTSSNIALLFNIGGAGILNEYFWNKYIGKEFQYRKRSWIKPAIISVIILIPFFLLAIYGE